jgi:PKD repeat protein
VLVSPAIGLQAATPVTFASQGAGGGSSGTLTYTWDFGDGTTGSGPLVTHVYGTSGLFTVKLNVSDGKKTAAATTASVTIRSLAGTWRGTLAGALGVTMTLTQNGAAVTGVYTDQAASGPLTGSARAASPRVNLVISPSGFPAASYAADPNAEVSRLTGIYRQQGLTIDLSLTKD